MLDKFELGRRPRSSGYLGMLKELAAGTASHERGQGKAGRESRGAAGPTGF